MLYPAGKFCHLKCYQAATKQTCTCFAPCHSLFTVFHRGCPAGVKHVQAESEFHQGGTVYLVCTPHYYLHSRGTPTPI